MNHADRQRLSQLLDDIGRIMEHETIYNRVGFVDAYSEARAIVNGPTQTATWGGNGYNFTTTFDDPPNPHLDAFLTEPIHEYNPRPDYGRIRHPLGWTKPGRRHRALSPRRIALTTLIAGMILLALVTSDRSGGATDGPTHTARPSETPSEAAQTRFQPGAAPYIRRHAPGSAGNGLGVIAP